VPEPAKPSEDKLLERIAFLEQENTILRQKLDAMARQLFGRKSEQLNETQMQLLFQELLAPGPARGNESSPEGAETEPPRRKKVANRSRSPRLPEHLPVIEEVIVPEPVKLAPEQWRRIGEEVSERLDYEPARFLRRRTVRPKYVRRGELDAVPIVAPLPESILERGIVAPGLLAHIVVSKYCDHLPLYRQESMYWTRHQVWLPRQTMAQWMGLAADWLRLIYEHIRGEVLSRGYVQVDETPIRYLEPGHGQTKRGYLWTCSDPRGDVVFHWETSRAAACMEKIIPVDFTGTIQCDGYEAYDCFARQRAGRIVLAGCMAHVRRKFYEAREHAPKVAGWILLHLKTLYVIESDLRDARAGPGLRQAERVAKSRPIIERLHRALLRLKLARRYLPQSAMGRAIDYALGQWPSLLVFLEDGRIEIDNNRVENAIRPTALGKKNWLFIGEAAAGERSAILYTIIESCRRRGIDPFAYLRDVFTRLPTATNREIKDLVPEAWAKRQPNVNRRAAA
jgi:transposase